MTGKAFSLLLLIFLGGAIIFIYLRYIERHTIFHPAKEIEFSPKEAGLNFEDIFFTTADNLKLNGWFVPSENAQYTILFCHGNAGNISHRIEKLRFFNQLGCNVFIFDYRGYGRSEGKPYEAGLYIDVRGAYDYLLSRKIAPQQIIGYGESLGGAAVIDLTCSYYTAALITDSTFSSTKDMVRTIYPFIPYWLFSTRFDSVKKIKSIKVPKLIIHSLNDEIVPFSQAQKLYDAAAEPKEFLKISGGHNISFYDSYGPLKEKIASFLNSIKK